VVRVVVVDDHPVVRDGLRGMLERHADVEVVGEANGGRAAVAVVARTVPDVVLMDLRMPGGSGVEAIREIVRRGISTRVLVLTTYDSDSDTTAAIEAGAAGYLLKDVPPEQLHDAVRRTAVGEAVLSPAVASALISRVRATDQEALSVREQQELELVARGTANREIAAALFISEATVKTHLVHIYAKLGVRDRAAAVAVAYERGVLGG
jgi:DNA-binding NarL/FixJ family response regulator